MLSGKGVTNIHRAGTSPGLKAMIKYIKYTRIHAHTSIKLNMALTVYTDTHLRGPRGHNTPGPWAHSTPDLDF